MAETTSTPDATGTSSRSDLLARFDGATWTPEDALLLWSFLANGTGAQSLAHLFEFLKNDFLRAAATVMAGNDTTEREALRLIVAGDYYQASNRLDEVFFVAPKESRSVVLRRQAALLGPVIPSTATVALKAAADLAPGDRLSRWTPGSAAGTARQARRSDAVSRTAPRPRTRRGAAFGRSVDSGCTRADRGQAGKHGA